MKKLIFLLLIAPISVLCQGITLKAGDPFPEIPINNIINAPVKSVNLNALKDKQFYILNFWGTWCSPCIPEMDALGKLQKANQDKIRIIGISDDTPAKLNTYLKNKPTTIWLAADTSYLLYRMFNLSSVSHSVIVNAAHKVVAVMQTHSVTQGLLDSLYRGEKIVSNAHVNEQPVNISDNIFAVDTTLAYSFTIRGYMTGQQAMGKRYAGKSPYAARRVSFVNTGLTTIYKAAYDIVSSNQIIYQVDKKTIENYEDKSQRYCLDLLVKPEDKDSLYVILQQKLNANLPVKARIEYKVIPVYVLTNNGFNLPVSSSESSYGFSGAGYDGKAQRVAEFAKDYLSNELNLPVVDETNLKERYDIKTSLDMRTMANVIKSVEALGLKLEKTERRMRMLVLYK